MSLTILVSTSFNFNVVLFTEYIVDFIENAIDDYFFTEVLVNTSWQTDPLGPRI